MLGTQITFTFSTPEEAALFLLKVQKHAKAAESVETPAAETIKQEAKRKPGAKKKEDTAAQITEKASVKEAAQPAGEKKYTLDDAREALQKVVAKKGMDKATAFIKGLGYQRISAVPAADYATFIEKCEKEAA